MLSIAEATHVQDLSSIGAGDILCVRTPACDGDFLILSEGRRTRISKLHPIVAMELDEVAVVFEVSDLGCDDTLDLWIRAELSSTEQIYVYRRDR